MVVCYCCWRLFLTNVASTPAAFSLVFVQSKSQDSKSEEIIWSRSENRIQWQVRREVEVTWRVGGCCFWTSWSSTFPVTLWFWTGSGQEALTDWALASLRWSEWRASFHQRWIQLLVLSVYTTTAGHGRTARNVYGQKLKHVPQILQTQTKQQNPKSKRWKNGKNERYEGTERRGGCWVGSAGVFWSYTLSG